MSKNLLLTSFFAVLSLSGCGNSNSPTIVAYGCEDKVEWNICNGKPIYLGETTFIISKEGRSVKATQVNAKGRNFFTEGTFNYSDCTITDSNNWSCKEKSPYGEMYFNKEMVDGFYISSISSQLINGSGISYVGYQGVKGQLIKYGLWHPTEFFKEGKKDSK